MEYCKLQSVRKWKALYAFSDTIPHCLLRQCHQSTYQGNVRTESNLGFSSTKKVWSLLVSKAKSIPILYPVNFHRNSSVEKNNHLPEADTAVLSRSRQTSVSGSNFFFSSLLEMSHYQHEIITRYNHYKTVVCINTFKALTWGSSAGKSFKNDFRSLLKLLSVAPSVCPLLH